MNERGIVPENALQIGSGSCWGNPKTLPQTEPIRFGFLETPLGKTVICGKLDKGDNTTCEFGGRCHYLEEKSQKEIESPFITTRLPHGHHIILNNNTYEATSSLRSKDDPVVRLTSIEYKLWKYFVENQGLLLSRIQIYDHVWDQPLTNIRIIDLNIKRLRDKLGGDREAVIQSIRQGGYRLRTKDDQVKRLTEG